MNRSRSASVTPSSVRSFFVGGKTQNKNFGTSPAATRFAKPVSRALAKLPSQNRETRFVNYPYYV
jgi:hypothetical protein